jgi:hypothetical protein
MTDEAGEIHDRAYAAIDRGALTEASGHFDKLLQLRPENRAYEYMRGLAHKYLRDWDASLHHNLRAIALAGEDDETQAEHWNAAIAATALGRWAEARRLWSAIGIRVAAGDGAIHDDFGVAVVRLNPWHRGETVFVRRIDPARARLLNVPLPESGHRFGDIVLHDGAPTGHRIDGQDREVPVFNELLRLTESEFRTFTVFVGCEEPDDLRALLDATGPGIGFTEDWTSGIAYHCLRCSYGTPHRHGNDDDAAWHVDRSLGIAAQSRLAVARLLDDWSSTGRGRRVDAVEAREFVVPGPEEGKAWWRPPDDD